MTKAERERPALAAWQVGSRKPIRHHQPANGRFQRTFLPLGLLCFLHGFSLAAETPLKLALGVIGERVMPEKGNDDPGEAAQAPIDYLRKAMEASESIRSALKAAEDSSILKNAQSYSWLKGLDAEVRVPTLRIPRLPTPEQQNAYQSAGMMLRRLADTIVQWRQQLQQDQQPAIVALLQGGIQINVERLAEESFHGLRIEGRVQGNPCVVLAHQATVQILCFVEKIEHKSSPRRIGFIIDGEETAV